MEQVYLNIIVIFIFIIVIVIVIVFIFILGKNDFVIFIVIIVVIIVIIVIAVFKLFEVHFTLFPGGVFQFDFLYALPFDVVKNGFCTALQKVIVFHLAVRVLHLQFNDVIPLVKQFPDDILSCQDTLIPFMW